MTLLSGRYRWLIGIASLPFILFLLIWLLSPLAARSLGNQVLESYGLQLSDETDIRLNLFRGKVSVDKLGVLKDSQPTASLDHLSVNIALLELFEQHVQIETFSMQGLHLPIEIDGDTIIIAGVNLAELEATGEEATETTTSETEEPAKFLVTAPLLAIQNLKFPVVFNGHNISASLEQLVLKELSLSPTHQQVKTDIVMALDDAKLNIAVKASITPEGLEATVKTHVDNFDLAIAKILDDPMLTALNGKLAVDIDTKVSSNATFDAFSIHIPTSQIHLNDFSAKPEENLLTKLDKLSVSLSNKTVLSLNDVEDLFTEGNVAIELAQLRAEDGNDLLANIESIKIPSIQYAVKGENINATVKNVLVAGILASQTPDNQPLFKSEQLKINGISASTSNLAINSIELAASESNVTLTSTGLPRELAAIATPVEESETATEEPASEIGVDDEAKVVFNVALKQFALTAPFAINVADETTSPAFAQQWNIDTLKVQNFNTETPEVPTVVELALSDGAYAKINADIDATVLEELPTGHLKANIRELDLYPYSPYIEIALGIVIRAGQLDQNIDVTLENGMIDGDTDLHLRGLKMASNTPLTTDALASGTALGLNQALGMLQDQKGNIDLDVPLSGDTQSPEFGIQGFTKLVIKKAAINQAKSYLVDTFVPYAKVVKLAVAGGSYLLKLRFEPLILQSGIEDFDDEQQQFISQLAQLMNDNPKQRLQACPIANSPDTLTQVGKQANTLKRLLVDTHGIESARVLLCTAKTNNKNDAENRIEFSFK